LTKKIQHVVSKSYCRSGDCRLDTKDDRAKAAGESGLTMTPSTAALGCPQTRPVKAIANSIFSGQTARLSRADIVLASAETPAKDRWADYS
jgi:hypothetical protein